MVQFVRIVGDLEGAFGGRADPGQGDAVELGWSAEVHIDPLLGGSRAHPRAGEIVGAAEVHLFVFVEKFELADLPLEGTAVIEGYSVEAAVRGGVKGDFVMQFAGGVDDLRRLDRGAARFCRRRSR